MWHYKNYVTNWLQYDDLGVKQIERQLKPSYLPWSCLLSSSHADYCG